jgi:hypothetical protein
MRADTREGSIIIIAFALGSAKNEMLKLEELKKHAAISGIDPAAPLPARCDVSMLL